MTPRTAWLVVLIGLAIAALCAIPLYFIGDRDPANDDALMGIVVLNLCGMLGLTILVVGLIIVVVTTWRGTHRHLS